MLERSGLLGFAAHFSGKWVLFLHLEHGFPQPFLPLWILPLVKAQLANASSWPRQPPVLLRSKYPLVTYCKGWVCTRDWDVPALKPSQASSRGTTKRPTDFSEKVWDWFPGNLGILHCPVASGRDLNQGLKLESCLE